jgi:mRNA interferase RelE/StbE
MPHHDPFRHTEFLERVAFKRVSGSIFSKKLISVVRMRSSRLSGTLNESSARRISSRCCSQEANSGYNIAILKYEIIFAPEAVEDFKRLLARDRSIIRDRIEVHLRHEPKKVSKSRIKRLQGVSKPQYRLRIDEFRIFYDVTENRVEILAIVPKSKASS